jgi:phosphopantothenoylcysteine decarboxylase/phosphopantothenate--cysteine ligase
MGKKIILGVTGSIAAYKACDLVRLYVKKGYEVWPVLTASACELVTPLTFETLAGHPAASGLFPHRINSMEHISLKTDADILVVAPATANIIGKFAGGIADDLLSTTYLSVTCPVLIAPAMNPAMWAHPAVKDNAEKLRTRGARFIGPDGGAVACGDIGEGKLVAAERIFDETLSILGD